MFNYLSNNEQYTANEEMNFETLQNAKRDLIGELEAIIQYDDHIHSTNIDASKETWEFIRDGELIHVGELLGIFFYLSPYQRQLVEQGLQRFNNRIKEN
ncbi:MAG: hypothetical protein J1F32_00070 [Erysipelotrichales bacterium]|nr:hypothetical protein [Erysipelotrichales bacterium]